MPDHGHDLGEAALVTERRRQRFRLAEDRKSSSTDELTDEGEGRVEIEPKVDRLDGDLRGLGKMLQRLQRSLKERDGLHVRGASDGFGSGLTPIRHRALP